MNNIKINCNNLSINDKFKHKIDNISDNKFIISLYKNLKELINKTEIKKDEIKIKELKDKPEKYLIDNEFTSTNIKNYIIKNLRNCYEFTYDNNKIIYFSKNEINSLPKIIYKMMYVIVLIKKLFLRKYSQRIYYYETSNRKEFPKMKNKILDSDNVNTALTFLEDETNGDIIIYRKEECLKVLIHELIHSNLIDEITIKSRTSREFRYFICSNYKILLNEAITETLACIINLLIICIIKNKTIKEMNDMFKNEYYYSNYICSKIKSYYNIKNIKNIIKNNGNNKECITYFPQYTNVFSYYFLKNILLNNHIKFGEVYKKYSKNYKINDDMFNKVIIKLLKEDVNKLDKRVIDVKDNNKSLKMSYYEIC